MLALLSSSVLFACAAPSATDEKRTETTLEELTVGGGRTAGCSTAIVRGLTEQLVQEVDCLVPGAYRSIAGVPGVSLSSAAQAAPYLHRDAAEALRQAAARGGAIHINSALRTLPQQYLLRKWAETGRCGIRIAARPGHSNHESGLAIDVASASSHRSQLSAQGWRWAGSGDPPHFNYSGGMDLRTETVRAFQRLWNRNNPSDRISEDGDYGPATESRLRQAPADGFPLGASCGTSPAPTPDAGMVEPDAAAPEPDAGEPDGGSSSSVCDRGTGCADCNAIAHECGFCAGSGQCLAGDGTGPFSGTCSSGWQWIPPSSCPMTPETDPDPDPTPTPTPEPEPEPMCAPVQSTLCTSGTECCAGLDCRRGVSYGTRCCAAASTSCSSGSDCCGYMDCISGTCQCRSSGRACLADGDCCSGSCRSGRCG